MGKKIFRNASRTACRQVHRFGRLRGAYTLAARWSEAAAFANARTDLQTQAEKLIEAHLAVRAEIWQAVAEGTGTRSIEQGLRGADDQSIAGAFIVEATRDRDLAEIARLLTPAAGEGAAVGGYRFLCALNRDQLD